VFLLSYEHRQAENGWDWLTKVAERRNTTAQELWHDHRPSDEEMSTPVLTVEPDTPSPEDGPGKPA